MSARKRLVSVGADPPVTGVFVCEQATSGLNMPIGCHGGTSEKTAVAAEFELEVLAGAKEAVHSGPNVKTGLSQ
jgi:hypothetical protein